MSEKCDAFRVTAADYWPDGHSVHGMHLDALSAWVEHLHVCASCRDWYMEHQNEHRGVKTEEFPCVHLAYYSTLVCDVHGDPWDCPDVLVVKTQQGFAIPIRDGGRSFVLIGFCPWCGISI